MGYQTYYSVLGRQRILTIDRGKLVPLLSVQKTKFKDKYYVLNEEKSLKMGYRRPHILFIFVFSNKQ